MFENSRTMLLAKNKLRVLFGVNAAHPTEKVLRSYRRYAMTFSEGENGQKAAEGSLFDPQGWKNNVKPFAEKDAKSLHDFLMSEFLKAGISGVSVDAMASSFGIALQLNILVEPSAMNPADSSKAMETILNKLDTIGLGFDTKMMRKLAC